MTILVNLNGDFDPITGLPIWDKELNDPDFVLPEITDETGDGKLDVNLTAAVRSPPSTVRFSPMRPMSGREPATTTPSLH